jgi:purine catabolism regulator
VVLVGRLAPGLVVAVHRRGSTAEWPDLGPSLVVGSGGTHHDVRGLRDSYEEALEVLDLARRQGRRHLRFDDAWFDRFLTGAVSADELAELVLAPIADLTANRRTAVLETLEAFLDCGGSVTAVADALHLHRQSVAYRLQNLRRHFGPMLLTANGRLALHIAVKATRLRPETSRQRGGRPASRVTRSTSG